MWAASGTCNAVLRLAHDHIIAKKELDKEMRKRHYAPIGNKLMTALLRRGFEGGRMNRFHVGLSVVPMQSASSWLRNQPPVQNNYRQSPSR